MNAQQKTRNVAAGIVLSGLLGSLIVLLSGGYLNTAKEALSISISVVTATALIKRANWARWLIGVGATLGLLLTIILLFDSRFFGLIFQSWLGLWFLLATGFTCWVIYTLFFDRQVVRYFKCKDTPELSNQKEAEQGGEGDAEEAV